MSINIYAYNSETGLQTYDSLEALQNLAEDSVIWLDIKTEDPEVLKPIALHFRLHELTVEDCVTPGHYPKIEDFGRYLFLMFRSLIPASSNINEDSQEEEEVEEEEYTKSLAIYVSDSFIITHRMRSLPWLDAVSRMVKQVPEKTLAGGTYELAHRIIDILIDRFARGLGYFDDLIDKLEDDVLANHASFDVTKILSLKRELATLRQIMREQRGIITRLANETALIHEHQLRRYFRDIDDHALAIINTITKQISSLTGVRDVYFAMANVRLGDIMRVLAVITTLGAPLNLLVGLYGMNFDVIPMAHEPYGFWLIVLSMLVIALFMILFFRKKRWM